MNAEEVLAKLLAANPELAKQIVALDQPAKKKRGRPKKKVVEAEPIIVDEDKENGIFRPNKNGPTRYIIDPSTGEKKTLTKSEEVDLEKIKAGENDFSEDDREKEEYYKERPYERPGTGFYKRPMDRTRGNTLVSKKCQECKKTVQVSALCGAASHFRCDDCLLDRNK